MNVFICGDSEELTDEFVSAVEQAEKFIKSLGLNPISLISFDRVKKEDIEIYERLDELKASDERKLKLLNLVKIFTIIAQCDAIYITDKLVNSDVAIIQIFIAQLLGIQFMLEDDTLHFMLKLTAHTEPNEKSIQSWFESQMEDDKK